ncbi:sigma factor-like helix-turn-helix DNA-binding protein [Lachnoclostridium sp. An138]|uniref:sigma factor-like helix-turn-helix DNA-binding protein n=1 Tax=Lachnoclostridium sp. An138 TaxID=1965560 RepID=UPI000B37D2E5|nr:hypothetical protein [Lachnoclostridium sp. An138]OUQ17745.1 hypothetical protein B5E82_09945 [Lachnoclostridium sp. An138]
MVVMEREQLERYLSQKEEIRELRYKLEHLGEGDSLIGNSTIFDYSTGYPKPQAVVGYDYNKEWRLRERYETRLEKLQVDCEETEQWIEAIPDSQTRRIFRMYYLEGETQQKIGKKLHLDQSSVSRKIENFLKLHSMHKIHNYNNT